MTWLTIPDACDASYALLRERVAQIALAGMTAGVEDASIDDSWERLDALLAEPLGPTTREEMENLELRRAVGVQ